MSPLITPAVGRDFLLRLVAEYGPLAAARVLRALADELDSLAPPDFKPSIYQSL